MANPSGGLGDEMASGPDYTQECFSRAEELRAFAQNMKNADARKLLMRVADDYERLAKSLSKQSDNGS